MCHLQRLYFAFALITLALLITQASVAADNKTASGGGSSTQKAVPPEEKSANTRDSGAQKVLSAGEKSASTTDSAPQNAAPADKKAASPAGDSATQKVVPLDEKAKSTIHSVTQRATSQKRLYALNEDFAKQHANVDWVFVLNDLGVEGELVAASIDPSRVGRFYRRGDVFSPNGFILTPLDGGEEKPFFLPIDSKSEMIEVADHEYIKKITNEYREKNNLRPTPKYYHPPGPNRYMRELPQ
jgi:hypothetical protein